MQEFAQTYRAASDDEIARLHGQIDSLTEQAQDSLRLEITRRKLNGDDLARLRSQLAEHASRVNQEWKESRKVDASRMATRFAIRVAVVIAAAILAAIIALVHSGH
jgi:predicted RNA-binding Zn ribbon-like protein